MTHSTQLNSKSIIPGLNKEIISKMNVSNLNNKTNKNGGKVDFVSTIPTGFITVVTS